MSVVEFQIEQSFRAGGRGYVVVRLLDRETRVELSTTPLLGGCPVERWLEMPRALDAEGRTRTDLFGFCLVRPDDLRRLSVGDHVDLV
jgi:hypothetical protein